MSGSPQPGAIIDAMRSPARHFLIATLLGFAAALIVALFIITGITIADVFAIIGKTPIEVLVGVILLTLCNQLISVFRWRLLSRWFAPGIAPPGWLAATRSTLRGSFVGQFVPLQLAMPLVRWASHRDTASVNATLYEQLFDFILLGTAALAAMALLYFKVDMSLAIIGLAAAVAVTVFTIPAMLQVTARLSAIFVSDKQATANRANHAVAILTRASHLPMTELFALAALSALRLVVLSVRTVIVIAIGASTASLAMVAIGYPIVGLALGVPFLPAGLGVADWSIAGLVLVAGGTVAAGAAAAVAIRVLNIAALGLLLACAELMPMPKSAITGDAAPTG